MRELPKNKTDDNLLIGIDDADDGAIYRLTNSLALIQTLDFFTPIVDDPYMFGQIAAANSLSDVYAMGGVPKTVLNIVAYPIKQLGPKILAQILHGSRDKVLEAGAQVVGGHSIDDKEPKFGLSVTGTVHPQKYFTNIGARPGDQLILTKPIGVGIYTTALKQEKLTNEQITLVTNVMRTLNDHAANLLTKIRPNAVTDVTGFGLLGHAYEMAKGSDVSFTIYKDHVPILPETEKFAQENIIPGGSRTNHQWLQDVIHYDKHLTTVDQLILCDAITSGGLLISLPKEQATSYIKQINNKSALKANIIGEVGQKRTKAIYVE